MAIFNGAEYDVLTRENFKLFSDFNGFSFPKADSKQGKCLVEIADKALEKELPHLTANLYRKYNLTGNRTEFEAVYFGRRQVLTELVVGEIIENKGRYIDKIVDVLWLILEETTWIIPAHNLHNDAHLSEGMKPSLPVVFDNEFRFVDLFSGETAALMALTYHFLKNKFPEDIRDIINERIVYSITTRVIKPYLKYNDMWWMGFGEKVPNNWNPWIIASVLTATATVEEDNEIRKKVLTKSLCCLDFFLKRYMPDGGCDEGPSYWNAAGVCLFDCLELMYDMTGGKADYFNDPLVYNMIDYIRKVHITDNYYTAFADSPTRLYSGGMLFAMRAAERTNNKNLYDFAASRTGDMPDISSRHMMYRKFKDICYNKKETGEYVPEKFDVLPDLQVAVIREKSVIVGAKGGHNGESHNHNDVGNVVVFANKKPLIIDIGGPTYTKDVFSEKRYTVFPINSTWHNLPVVNGYGEKEGKEFTSDFFEADENSIKIGYKSAYEKEAGVKNAVREIEVLENSVTIFEKVEADGEVIFNYYIPEKPERDKNVFVFADRTQIICPENVRISLDEIPVTDASVIRNWNTETLYRISVKGTEFKLEIKVNS